MAVYPAIRVRFTPGGFLIQATELFRDNALLLLLLVPYWTFSFIHHLIGTDDAIIAPVQETFEK